MEMKPSSDSNELVVVSIRFTIGLFEVSIRGETRYSNIVEYIVNILNQIKADQGKIVQTIEGMNMGQIKPIEQIIKPIVEDALQKISDRLQIPVDKLRQILRIEDEMPIIIKKERFASPEKGALVLIYVYQFGLNKKPSHKEVSIAFKSSGFSPAFGVRSKQALKQRGKIAEENDTITLQGPGISDAEEEIKRIVESIK